MFQIWSSNDQIIDSHRPFNVLIHVLPSESRTISSSKYEFGPKKQSRQINLSFRRMHNEITNTEEYERISEIDCIARAPLCLSIVSLLWHFTVKAPFTVIRTLNVYRFTYALLTNQWHWHRRTIGYMLTFKRGGLTAHVIMYYYSPFLTRFTHERVRGAKKTNLRQMRGRILVGIPASSGTSISARCTE